MFYLILENLDARSRLIRHLKEAGILAVFHYVPLHSAPAGIKYARVNGTMAVTEDLSERLVRLPLYHNLEDEDILKISAAVKAFFGAGD